MKETIDPREERVVVALTQLRLIHVRDILPALLSEATRDGLTYLEFLDEVLGREVESKQGKRVRMGLQIAHFPCVQTLDDFNFGFQPSVDERLIRELSSGQFISNGENVLMFGPPGVGKTHLAVDLGRKIVGQGHTVRFITAMGLPASLSKAESEGSIELKLSEFSKTRLLIVDELGYLPFERLAGPLFFQLVNRHYERGGILITTNQRVSEWGTVFGDETLATAILDCLLHYSHTSTINGKSYRLCKKRKASLIRSGLTNLGKETDESGKEAKEQKGSTSRHVVH